eukprot:8385972-Karenia_brevis.AAC.1
MLLMLLVAVLALMTASMGLHPKKQLPSESACCKQPAPPSVRSMGSLADKPTAFADRASGVWPRPRCGAAEDVSQERSLSLTLDQVNVTGWGTLKKWLEATSAHVVIAQEIK